MATTRNTVKRGPSLRPDMRKLRPVLFPVYKKGGVNAVIRAAKKHGLTKLQAYDCCRRWVQTGQ